MKKLFLSVFIITMITSCSSDDGGETTTDGQTGQISKTIEVDEYGDETTSLYTYNEGKIADIKATVSGVGVNVTYVYNDNKLVKMAFSSVLIEGYQSFIYSENLIKKIEYYDSFNGESISTLTYNNLNQVIQENNIDEDDVTTITTYTYNQMGNRDSAKSNGHTILYEYDDKVNPLKVIYSLQVMNALGISNNNLKKETDGSNITKYNYTYTDEGLPFTVEEFDGSDLIFTTTYFYN